ncbi:transposase [Bacillus thuringiensis serovar argentinensis]|nr:transposase [Bacillus thuringiensis serovar argentinensis]
MQSLVHVVIHCTSKKRSLVVANSVYVYIGHEWFRCLLKYVKHEEDFEIQRIWQNVSLHVYDPVLSDCSNS